MPRDIWSEREAALRLFCETLAVAASAAGTVAMIRVMAWMDARDEREGGFLWLAAALGYQPEKMAAMLRTALEGPPRWRQAVERRLQRVYADAS